MTVLVWTSVGGAAGLEHLDRGLALAAALVRHGVATRFALAPDPVAIRWLGREGHPDPQLVPSGDAALPHVLAAARTAAGVVVDVDHEVAPEAARALGAARPLIVVTHGVPAPREAALVVAPCAETAGIRRLAGPAYVPLRLLPDRPAAGGERPRVLLHLGAGVAATAPAIVRGLARVGDAIALRIAVEPHGGLRRMLAPLVARLGLAPATAIGPGGLPACLGDSDVAVVAAGLGVFVAMGMGVPPLVLCDGEEAMAWVRRLAAQGAVRAVGRNWTEDSLAAAVRGVVADPGRLALMRVAGRTLVDGRGAERVAERIVPLLAPADARPGSGLSPAS